MSASFRNILRDISDGKLDDIATDWGATIVCLIVSLVAALLLLKGLWPRVIPNIFPGAVVAGFIVPEISWLLALGISWLTILLFWPGQVHLLLKTALLSRSVDRLLKENATH